MKKVICFSLVLLFLFGCLTACYSTQTKSGVLAGEAEATPKVEEMMIALAGGNMSDARALMHPKAAETSGSAITQMCNYLASRQATSMEQKSISVNTTTGSSGTTRQEQVSYRVTLTDDEVIYLNVVYLSDHLGTGFHSFQLVLGVV